MIPPSAMFVLEVLPSNISPRSSLGTIVERVAHSFKASYHFLVTPNSVLVVWGQSWDFAAK